MYIAVHTDGEGEQGGWIDHLSGARWSTTHPTHPLVFGLPQGTRRPTPIRVFILAEQTSGQPRHTRAVDQCGLVVALADGGDRHRIDRATAGAVDFLFPADVGLRQRFRNDIPTVAFELNIHSQRPVQGFGKVL